MGDNADVFPTDEDEWADLDGDGVGDNGDACPLEAGLSLYPMGCPDRDGDGYANTNDDFPSDPTEWVDTDGDGYGDNTDLFPNDGTDWPTETTIPTETTGIAFPFDASEWNDTDGEGVGDNQDRFPNDASEWNDTDDDGCGDNMCLSHIPTNAWTPTLTAWAITPMPSTTPPKHWIPTVMGSGTTPTLFH